jgi:hypothetical protein
MDFQCQILEKLATKLPIMLAAVSSDTRFLTTEAPNLNAPPGSGLSHTGDLILARLAYAELASPADPLRTMARHTPDDALPSKQLPIEGRLRIHLADTYVRNTVFLEDAVCSLLQEPRAGQSLAQPPPHSPFEELEAQQPRPYANRNLRMRIFCWDTKTGKRIRESKALWSRSAVPMSTGSGRIAIGDDGWPAVNPDPAAPRLHTIWDFKNGQVMAEWSPELGQGPGTELGARVGFAISPDGHLIAEGGVHSVRIYRLP